MSDLDPYQYPAENNAQVACAIAFARAHATDYGGDPARVIVFGHSGGSNVGSVVVFGDTEPAAGCLADGPVAPVGAFVTWSRSSPRRPHRAADPALTSRGAAGRHRSGRGERAAQPITRSSAISMRPEPSRIGQPFAIAIASSIVAASRIV